ncbi:hypothetical protein D3C80_1563610 [compost metagenome]
MIQTFYLNRLVEVIAVTQQSLKQVLQMLRKVELLRFAGIGNFSNIDTFITNEQRNQFIIEPDQRRLVNKCIHRLFIRTICFPDKVFIPSQQYP